MDRRQLAWMLMSIVRGLWLISRSGPMVWAISSWAHAVLPVFATLLSTAILLRVGSRPAQLLFHAAWERMTAQNPPATDIEYEINLLDPRFTNLESFSVLFKQIKT